MFSLLLYVPPLRVFNKVFGIFFFKFLYFYDRRTVKFVGQTAENDICSTGLGRRSGLGGGPSCHGLNLELSPKETQQEMLDKDL